MFHAKFDKGGINYYELYSNARPVVCMGQAAHADRIKKTCINVRLGQYETYFLERYVGIKCQPDRTFYLDL